MSFMQVRKSQFSTTQMGIMPYTSFQPGPVDLSYHSPIFFSGVDVAYKPASKINSNGVILIITVFYQVSSMPMISIFSK